MLVPILVHLGQIWGTKLFLLVLPQQIIRHFSKLSSNAIVKEN